MLAERAKEIRLSEQESGKQPSKKLSWPSEPRWEPFTSNLIKRLHQSKSFLPPSSETMHGGSGAAFMYICLSARVTMQAVSTKPSKCGNRAICESGGLFGPATRPLL